MASCRAWPLSSKLPAIEEIGGGDGSRSSALGRGVHSRPLPDPAQNLAMVSRTQRTTTLPLRTISHANINTPACPARLELPIAVSGVVDELKASEKTLKRPSILHKLEAGLKSECASFSQITGVGAGRMTDALIFMPNVTAPDRVLIWWRKCWVNYDQKPLIQRMERVRSLKGLVHWRRRLRRCSSSSPCPRPALNALPPLDHAPYTCPSPCPNRQHS